MAILHSVAFILVAASLFGAGVEAKRSCPKYTLDINYSNVTAVTELKRTLVRSSLESPAFSTPTPLIKELHTIIKEMIDSSFASLQRIAFVYVIRSTLLLTTYNTDNNFCVTAEGLSVTANFAETEHVEEVAEYLKKFGDSVAYNRQVFNAAALLVANCKNADPPKLTPPSCPDNGLVDYPIKQIWKLFGRFLPCPLKEVVFKLYKSDNQEEKAHALMVTAALTQSVEEVTQRVSQIPTYETLYLFSIDKVHKCCCEERKDFLNQLTENRTTEIKQKVLEVIEEKYSC